MSSEADFGDADFEPSDEQLHALSSEAFLDVAARNAEALERLRAEVDQLRVAALRRLARDPAP